MVSPDMESVSIKYVNDIKENVSNNEFTLMTENVTSLTKLLFTNPDLIYTSLNDEFEQSGVLHILIGSFARFSEQSKRDILRLLNIFLKTNPKIRNEMTQCTSFTQLLLKKLNNKEVWSSIDKIKYYINIASYLLLNKESRQLYETGAIRRILRPIIVQSKKDTNYGKRILTMIFYSSAQINADLETPEDQDDEYEKVMCKDIVNLFIEMIRDYLYDFTVFYKSLTGEKNRFCKYGLKAEYSFDQICQCIYYYAQFNATLQHNIFQSGLYELLSDIFLIKGIPESFLLQAVNIFSIPSFDPSLKERFRKEHNLIIDKLKNLRSTNYFTLKPEVEKLLEKYDCNSNNSPNTSSLPKCMSHTSSQTNVLITFSQSGSHSSDQGFNVWGSLDVEYWLKENNLQKYGRQLASLTGRGLNQLKLLMNETNGKFQLIELLTSKLEMDLVSVLELLGALECFEAK